MYETMKTLPTQFPPKQQYNKANSNGLHDQNHCVRNKHIISSHFTGHVNRVKSLAHENQSLRFMSAIFISKDCVVTDFYVVLCHHSFE